MRLSTLLLYLDVAGEKLPGRRSDQLVASALTLAFIAFAVLFMTAGRVSAPPAQALSSDRPDAHGLYRFDGKPVSHQWRWLLASARQAGWQGKLNSGVRSWRKQARLHQRFVDGQGPPAFHPDGPSRHMLKNAPEGWQHAVDVTHSGRLMMIGSAAGIELTRPYPSEPWHLEAKEPFGVSP